jgi:hypothetical protein
VARFYLNLLSSNTFVTCPLPRIDFTFKPDFHSFFQATARHALRKRPILLVSLARLLAHYESEKSSATTLVPMEFCRELARGMRAEKITRRLYRLFPPDSIFTPAKDFPQPHGEIGKLGPGEIAGLRFKHPNPARLKRVRWAETIQLLGEYTWADNQLAAG